MDAVLLAAGRGVMGSHGRARAYARSSQAQPAEHAMATQLPSAGFPSQQMHLGHARWWPRVSECRRVTPTGAARLGPLGPWPSIRQAGRLGIEATRAGDPRAAQGTAVVRLGLLGLGPADCVPMGHATYLPSSRPREDGCSGCLSATSRPPRLCGPALRPGASPAPRPLPVQGLGVGGGPGMCGWVDGEGGRAPLWRVVDG